MSDAENDLERNRELVQSLWRDLYQRNFDGLKKYFAEHAHYEDVPAPDAGAIGPEAIVARLRVGLEPIEKQVHHLHRMVAEGDTVMTEHTEEWHWPSGESVALPFLSVHVIEDGLITVWKDYWNLGTLMDAAPAWWLEHIMKQAVEVGLRDPDESEEAK